ncbi:MAG: hypothetical protein RRA92_02560 [Gemmatimonadota bacterium]|nr:hypothetical protein [Gemmatimonadota bacterium]
MEILPGRMIYLGYGKFWRSDEIVGLLPIEEGRGPGRRTEVWVATREEPIVASRSEQTILGDMAALPDGTSRAAELRSAIGGLVEELGDLPPVLRRLLKREGGLDADFWIRRLRALSDPGTGAGEDEPQEDLFGEE